MNANGDMFEKAYYLPWGGERGNTSITSTDYGYTGQMREGDIYDYGARWNDPTIGRFMQADTIVPLQVQGTQAFDRYAYVNNNPMKYVDPSGNLAITTAILIGSAVVGGLASYGWQVYQNTEYGLDFKEALTTDINIEQIVGTAITTAFVASIGIDVVSIASGIVAAFKAVCADGDCTNEVDPIIGGMQQGIQNINSTKETAVKTYWPSNNGFLGKPTVTTVEPGTIIERIGSFSGRYAAPLGTPIWQKSLPPAMELGQLTKFEVLKPIENVLTGITAPAFGRIGGGTQFLFENSIQHYINNGFIKLLQR